MAEYTPTTEEVRNLYVNNADVAGMQTLVEVRVEFDRWLAQVRAEAKAEGVDAAAEELVRRDQFSERTLDILSDLAAAIRTASGITETNGHADAV